MAPTLVLRNFCKFKHLLNSSTSWCKIIRSEVSSAEHKEGNLLNQIYVTYFLKNLSKCHEKYRGNAAVASNKVTAYAYCLLSYILYRRSSIRPRMFGMCLITSPSFYFITVP